MAFLQEPQERRSGANSGVTNSVAFSILALEAVLGRVAEFVLPKC